MLGLNTRVSHRNHEAFHQIPQLANIAGPGVESQQPHRVAGDVFRFAMVLSRELTEKSFGQEWDVVSPLAERRETDRHDVEPVIEVFPKIALFDCFFEITIGGRDNAGIDRDQLRSSQASEFFGLQAHAENRPGT